MWKLFHHLWVIYYGDLTKKITDSPSLSPLLVQWTTIWSDKQTAERCDGCLIPEKDYEWLDVTNIKATSTRHYKLWVRSNASLKRFYDSREKRHQAVRSLVSTSTNCLIARSLRNFWTMSSHHCCRRHRGCGFASVLLCSAKILLRQILIIFIWKIARIRS